MRRRPLALRFAEQLVGVFAVLLWAGALLAVIAGMPQLSVAIVAVVLVNGIFSFLQEYRAERALEALDRLLPNEIGVRRDGFERRVAALALVPGDVVLLAEGDQVPADGRVLESELLRVDQGSLTGEPHPVFKVPVTAPAVTRTRPEERPDLVFAGTGVASGSGVMVATATGMSTVIGGIAHLTQSVGAGPSPLAREVGRVTRRITALALALGATFFAAALATGRMTPQGSFLLALGVIVANVPEGLLPQLTLSLAIGAQRLALRRSVVKRLSAVETLGSVTVICTDKTGTLTENRMTLRHLWVDGVTREAGAEDGAARELLEAAALASTATRDHGDPTERALVEAAERCGVDVEAARAAQPIRAVAPFDSSRKRMSIVRSRAGRTLAYVKGAPRELIGLCAFVRRQGRDLPLSGPVRAGVAAEHDRLAGQGLRLLAVAVRPLERVPAHPEPEAVEQSLALLGLVALWDPPRPEVAESVALCRRAGIRAVMITGDDGLTARSIARQVGLPTTRIVAGEEVDRLPREALRDLALVPGVLFARTSPAQKLAVVQALRGAGEIVAVTGDGVNDAPALKAADIGVAMGRRGSQVAREAAEMVITDDHFASIVAAVSEGRSIFSNLGRFVRYVLASNVPELAPFLAFALFRIPLPLTLLQILAVDLGTDLLPALALGAEPPEPGVMERPPRSRSERLLSGSRLALAYGFLGVAEAALSLAGFFWVYWLSGWRPGAPMAAEGPLYQRATTVTFAGIVAAQVGNVFACRTERESVFRVGLLSNRLVLWAVAAELGLLFALVLVPPLARFFGFAPPAFREWGPLLSFPVVILLLEEARKWILRRRRAR